jgi:Subtilase family
VVASGETTFDSTNIDYVAYYSSRGPTYDNRIKPDLVSPGHAIVSAKAGTSCDTMEKSGKLQYVVFAAADLIKPLLIT